MVLKSITNFHRRYLLILRIGTDGIGSADGHIDCLELRRTADEAGIDKYIVVLGELVVHTSLNCSAYARNAVARGNIIIIVAVGTPVMVEEERTVDESREVVLAVLEAGEHTFLYNRTGVVTVAHIAYAEFLIYPVGVIAVGVIRCIHFLAGSIHIIVSAHEIGDDRLVNTLVETGVNTGGEFQTIQELLVVRRYNAYPVMVVTVETFHELGAVLGSGVHVIDSLIVEHTGGLVTELDGIRITVSGAVSHVAVGAGVVQTVLRRTAATTADRHICRR